ncbi:hypothetical protein BDW66DRAFT_146553 [Aspergillus desertorum]
MLRRAMNLDKVRKDSPPLVLLPRVPHPSWYHSFPSSLVPAAGLSPSLSLLFQLQSSSSSVVPLTCRGRRCGRYSKMQASTRVFDLPCTAPSASAQLNCRVKDVGWYCFIAIASCLPTAAGLCFLSHM